MRVRFWGTRGSIATPGPGTNYFGGNTSCVELTTANGDLLNWVATGEKDVQTGANEGTVHFVGGTGRFEVAAGSFAITTGTGTIRY